MRDVKSQPRVDVRIIIQNDDGKTLLIRRATTKHALGSWCLPGGKVDYGQTVEQAVKKEIQEELSLECTFCRFLFYMDNLPSGTLETHYITLVFSCDTNGTIKLNDESSEYVWVGIDDLGRYEIAFQNDVAMKRYWETSAL